MATYQQPQTTTPDFLEEYIKKLESQAEETRVGYQKQEAEVRAIWDEIITRYQPGGTFQQRMEEQLGRRKEVETGQELQHLISSGLYGTSTAGGVGRRWEQEVGGPARLGYEDIMMQRLSQAQVGKAGFVGDVEREYPDVGLIAQLAGMAAQQPSYMPQTATAAAATPETMKGPSPWEAGFMGGGWTLGSSQAAPVTPATGVGGTGPPPGGGVTIPMGKGYGPAFGDTGGGGDTTITIYSGNPSITGQPTDSTKTVNIPAGMTGGQAMEAGMIPSGWATKPQRRGPSGAGAKPLTYRGGSFGGGFK